LKNQKALFLMIVHLKNYFAKQNHTACRTEILRPVGSESDLLNVKDGVKVSRFQCVIA